MLYFICEIFLLLVFLKKGKEWAITFILSIVYAFFIYTGNLSYNLYLILNIAITVSLVYTLWCFKKYSWWIDVFPLISIKILSIIIVLYPKSIISNYYFSFNISDFTLRIDEVYFWTLILVVGLEDITFLKVYKIKYLRKYVLYSLSLLSFLILY